MLTEQTHTEPNWALLPGTILDGGYEMQELLEADERRARFKIRVLGDRTIDAFASFFPVVGKEGEEQVAAWELVRRSPHPNLSAPLAAGQRQLDGAPVAYVVLRRADETLSGVLGERALTPDEASEVLLNSSRALAHLNSVGLVHGAVSPEQVLAVGDSIQLSTEGVRKADGVNQGFLKQQYVAPENGAGDGTAAGDVWCLAATVFETVTQKVCAEGCRDKAKQFPGPLGWVLDRCLDPDPSTRARAEEIPALFKTKPIPAPVPPQLPETPVQAGPPPEERKAASAAAGASGGSASVASVAPPAYSVLGQAEVNAPQSKPSVSSASQARVKAFKQAGFDALIAPEGQPQNLRGAPLPGQSSSAVPASTPFGVAQPAANGPRASQMGGSTLRTPQAEVQTPELRPLPERRGLRFEPEPQRSRLLMYVAIGAVVLLLMIWALRPKQTRPLNSAPIASSPAQKGVGAANKSTDAAPGVSNAWPTRTLEPEKAVPGVGAPKQNPEPIRRAAATKTEATPVSGSIWRVVVYTFSKPEDAQKKVRIINAKHPRLQAQVFSPNGQAGPYLVTLGGRMTRDEAARSRSRAIGSGMPHDSYIQNYRQ